MFDDMIPKEWTPWVPIATGLVRDGLKVLGGMGFVWSSTVSGSQIESGVSIAFVVAGVVWSAIQKMRAQKALETAKATPPADSAVPKLPS